MNVSPAKQTAAFTLVELIIGMTLSLAIMGAILSSYVFLGRSFTRSLGLSSANQATLESQGRKTLSYFEQDVRMASGIDPTPPSLPDSFSNRVTLALPSSSLSGTNKVLYYYNGSASSVYLHDPPSDTIDGVSDATSLELPAAALTRVLLDAIPRSVLVLHRNLLSCTFSYYDNSGGLYTIFDPAIAGYSSLNGIQQLAMSFSAQGGSSVNGTQTAVYTSKSPPLIMRNRQPLP